MKLFSRLHAAQKKVNDAMAEMDSVVKELLDTLSQEETPAPGPAPTPTPIPTPAPTPPPVAPPAPAPVPSTPLEMYQRVFTGSPFHWEVGYAIFIQETGYHHPPENPGSRLLVEDNNPGGIKTYQEASSGGPGASGFMKYPSLLAGIKDHLHFLMRDHYQAARNLAPAQQAEEIWKAGYSELNPEWIANVQALIGQMSGTGDVQIWGTATGGAQIAIVALAHVGKPFVYADGTDNGNLGCADVVSSILHEAGVKVPIILGVDALCEALLAIGWKAVFTETAGPVDFRFASGDVIDWVTTPETAGHQHVGIAVVESGVVWTVQNSSSHKDIEKIKLADYPRAIRRVLRGGSS